MGMTVNLQAAETRLDPAPIRAEWVVEGRPVARSAELSRSADGMAMTAIWDCTAGVFDWRFHSDETVHILEGEVVIDGHRVLRPGDVAFFPAGSQARWRVPVYVKKLAFCRDAIPRPLRLLVQIYRRLRTGLTTTALGAMGVIGPEPVLVFA